MSKCFDTCFIKKCKKVLYPYFVCKNKSKCLRFEHNDKYDCEECYFTYEGKEYKLVWCSGWGFREPHWRLYHDWYCKDLQESPELIIQNNLKHIQPIKK